MTIDILYVKHGSDTSPKIQFFLLNSLLAKHEWHSGTPIQVCIFIWYSSTMYLILVIPCIKRVWRVWHTKYYSVPAIQDIRSPERMQYFCTRCTVPVLTVFSVDRRSVVIACCGYGGRTRWLALQTIDAGMLVRLPKCEACWYVAGGARWWSLDSLCDMRYATHCIEIFSWVEFASFFGFYGSRYSWNSQWARISQRCLGVTTVRVECAITQASGSNTSNWILHMCIRLNWGRFD